MEGIEVYNEYGKIQFNTSAKNLAYSGKGSHSVKTEQLSAPIGTQSILRINGGQPLIAFRPRDGQTMCVFQVVRNGNHWAYYIMASGTNSLVIDYWIFDAAVQNMAGSFGLNVWAENGELTFSSAMRPMKIVDIYNVGSSDYQTPAPAGKTYAMIQGWLSGRWDWIDVSNEVEQPRFQQFVYWDGMTTFGNGVQMNNALLDRATIDSPYQDTVYINTPNFLVVDVTNL